MKKLLSLIGATVFTATTLTSASMVLSCQDKFSDDTDDTDGKIKGKLDVKWDDKKNLGADTKNQFYKDGVLTIEQGTNIILDVIEGSKPKPDKKVNNKSLNDGKFDNLNASIETKFEDYNRPLSIATVNDNMLKFSANKVAEADKDKVQNLDIKVKATGYIAFNLKVKILRNKDVIYDMNAFKDNWSVLYPDDKFGQVTGKIKLNKDENDKDNNFKPVISIVNQDIIDATLEGDIITVKAKKAGSAQINVRSPKYNDISIAINVNEAIKFDMQVNGNKTLNSNQSATLNVIADKRDHNQFTNLKVTSDNSILEASLSGTKLTLKANKVDVDTKVNITLSADGYNDKTVAIEIKPVVKYQMHIEDLPKEIIAGDSLNLKIIKDERDTSEPIFTKSVVSSCAPQPAINIEGSQLSIVTQPDGTGIITITIKSNNYIDYKFNLIVNEKPKPALKQLTIKDNEGNIFKNNDEIDIKFGEAFKFNSFEGDQPVAISGKLDNEDIAKFTVADLRNLQPNLITGLTEGSAKLTLSAEGYDDFTLLINVTKPDVEPPATYDDRYDVRKITWPQLNENMSLRDVRKAVADTIHQYCPYAFEYTDYVVWPYPNKPASEDSKIKKGDPIYIEIKDEKSYETEYSKWLKAPGVSDQGIKIWD